MKNNKFMFLILIFSFFSACTSQEKPKVTTADLQVTPTTTFTQTQLPTPIQTSMPTVAMATLKTTSTIASSQIQPPTTSVPMAIETLDARTRFLFNEPASNVIQFFLAIQDAVKANDRNGLSELVQYPISIYLPTDRLYEPGDESTTISNQEEFVANYDQIVTPTWRNIILTQDPMQLFTNWQGVMVHRGELWFSPICLDQNCGQIKYYIIAINEVLLP